MSEQLEIKVPSLGESVSEAAVARWLKQPGEVVAADEVVVELETDKVTMEVMAPTAGVIGVIHHPEGSTVTVGQILGTITAGAPAPVAADLVSAKIEANLEQVIKKVVAEEVLPERVAEHVRQSASMLASSGPAAQRLVAEQNLDAGIITATGKEGRLTKADVIGFMEGASARPGATSQSTQVIQEYTSDAREERVKMTRLRQRISERLKLAQNTAAILTTFNEVDMTAVFKIRNQYREAFEKKHGVRLGFMSFFVKAAIRALKEIPAVNAEIAGDEIIYKNYYDIGVAVSAPQGLVVPIVRDADQLSFAEVEKKINELGVKARDGKLTIEEMTGGTFTVSNGGVFGSLMSTPILNPPQTGIMGMHKVQDRPMAIDGKVEIRPMMYIALSYDHRLIDGREAVTFLVRIKENIENPERLLLEV